MMKALSIIGLLTAVAGAVASQVTAINPKAGAWVMLGGTVASAVGGALKKYGAGNSPAVTALGIIVAAFSTLAMATNMIPATWAAIFGILGTAAAAAGQSLFGWGSDPEEPVVGSNLRSNGLTILLTFGLLGVALASSACTDDQQRKAEEGIRKIYVGLQGASDAVDEIYHSKLRKLETARLEGGITPEELEAKKKEAAQYALAGQEGIKKVSIGVKLFKERVRSLPAITKDNKVQLLPLLDGLVTDIEKARAVGLVGIPRERVAEVEAIYELLKGGVVTLQGVISAIKQPVPTRQIPALVQ